MTALRTHILLILSLLALVAAGCGGDDEPKSASTTETTATQPETTAKTTAKTTEDKAEEAEEKAKTTPQGSDDAETAAFVKAADSTCKDQRKKLRGVQQDLVEAGKGSQEELRSRLTDALRQQLTIARETTDELEKLDAPAASQEKWAEIIRVRRKIEDVQKDYRRALEAKDAKKVAALAQSQARAERKAGRLAGQLGIEAG